MEDEELTVMQEELMAAQSELEELRATVADREARATHVEEELAQLRAEFGEAREERQAVDEEVAGLQEQAEALRAEVKRSAERYREVALEQLPELPQELVTGETVAEVDAALQRARETVSKVRGHLESQAQAGRVPVGSPPRSGPDLSGMSAEEKIRFGLQQQDG